MTERAATHERGRESGHGTLATAIGRRRLLGWPLALSGMAVAPRVVADSRPPVAGQPGTPAASETNGGPMSPARALQALPRLESLQLDFAGYLVSGVGASPIAAARLIVEVGGSRYRVVVDVDSFLADLVYESEGRLDEAGLHPEYYRESRKIVFRSQRVKEVRLRETDDPARTNHHDGKTLWVPPGTQDRVSLIFQYMLMARADADMLRAGREIDIPYARFRDVAPSRWAAGPAERIRALSAEERTQGPFAYRIGQVGHANADVDAAFWIWAGELRLPLMLEFSEKGRSLRFVATAFR